MRACSFKMHWMFESVCTDTHAHICTHFQVLTMDASNVEAIACLAAHHFYNDQPELALRYFRRLLQMGVSWLATLGNQAMGCACCRRKQQWRPATSHFQPCSALGSSLRLAGA